MTYYPIVLVDDLRIFIEQVEATELRTLEQAMQWLNNVTADDSIGQLWLDHDLGRDAAGNETDVMAFVKELERRAFFDEAPHIEQILVQTSNSTGAKNIMDALARFFPTVRLHQVELKNYFRPLEDGETPADELSGF